MAKRFSRLSYALKKLLNSPTFDGTGTGNTPPTGSVLEKYASAVKNGVKYGAKPAASKPGEIITVAVNPFGLGAADANKYAVKMSKRSFDKTELAGVKTACNILVYDPAEHERLAGYRPAKANVFILGAQTSTEKTSKVTGLKYNPRDGHGYTFPVGTKTGTTLMEARKAIITAAKTANAKVSFQSEKL